MRAGAYLQYPRAHITVRIGSDRATTAQRPPTLQSRESGRPPSGAGALRRYRSCSGSKARQWAEIERYKAGLKAEVNAIGKTR